MDTTEIVKRFEELMTAMRLTKNALAVMAGIDPRNFSKMLSGQQTITEKTLGKISDATHCDLGWLKLGQGTMFGSNGSGVNTNSHHIEQTINDTELIGRLLSQIEDLREQVKEKDRRITELTDRLLGSLEKA